MLFTWQAALYSRHWIVLRQREKLASANDQHQSWKKLADRYDDSGDLFLEVVLAARRSKFN